MNYSIVRRLEHLSAELLIEIFEYLTPHELYLSFAQLNNRLNSILKSLPKLILVIETPSDPVISFFKSFIAVRINLPLSIDSKFDQFDFSNFVGIRSFSIPISTISYCRIEPFHQVDIVIRPDLCPRLESLRLPCCSLVLVEFIFTGAFPHLKIFHVGKCRAIGFPSLTITSLPALRRLTIPGRNGSEFQKFLSICPNLSWLDFYVSDDLLSSVLPTLRYPFIKCLRLSRLKAFLFHDGRFDSLLSLFPNLLVFHLIVNQYHQHDEIIDFTKVADSLNQYLPRLKKLIWLIYLAKRNWLSLHNDQYLQKIAQMHPLFKCVGNCAVVLHIGSYDLTSKYSYNRVFIRPSSEL